MEQAVTQEKKYLNIKEILAYSFGLFGLQAVIFYINSYQIQFYSYAYADVFGKDIFWVPFIILAAKVISSFFDPIVGNLIEKTKGKHGKLKPFIIMSILPLTVFTVLLFLDLPIGKVGMYIYIFIFTTLWSIAMTVGDIPSQGMSAVMTPNPTERTNLIGISGTLKSIGQSAPLVFVPLICGLVKGGAPMFAKKGTVPDPINSTEYLISAIGIAVIGCLLFSLICFFNKERVPYKSEKMTFKQLFKVIKTNKYLLLVMISYFLGFARQGAMAIQAQTAHAVLGDMNQIIVLGLSMAAGTMISMTATPFLIKKFDERKVFISMSIYGFVSSILAYFVAVWTNFSLFAVIPTLFLVGLQSGAVNIMPMVMVADSVDYYEHATGQRTEGVAYAVLSFSIKVTLALGSAVCMAVIFSSKVGYSAVSTIISESTRRGVYFSYTVIPGITSLLAAIPIFFYDIVGAKKQRISDELNLRRQNSKLN